MLIEQALTGSLREPAPEPNRIFVVRMNGEGARRSFGSLGKTMGLNEHSLSAAALSAAADGQSSELRFETTSPATATKAMDELRSMFVEMATNDRTAELVATKAIGVEASGNTVAIRCRAPLQEFIALLEAVQPKAQHHAHP